jgi:hypothetical protein
MQRVVMFSGGIGSWACAKRVVERHGVDDLTLLFTDTLIEDWDLYRFLEEASSNVGGTLVRIADGRTPWQIFRDERFLGNSSVDPCSKILKRELADRWLRENCDPVQTVCYVGIDWTEAHRYTALRDRRAVDGWRYEAPMIDPPYLTKHDMLDWARREGLRPSRAYVQGFSHDNCGGGCIKAGQGAFALLLRERPFVFAQWEAEEQGIREFLGADVSILTDRSGDGKKKPLPLSALRARIENDGQIDLFDIGGCGCFV